MPGVTGFPDALGEIGGLDEGELSKMSGRLPSMVSVIARMVDLVDFRTLGNVFTAHIARNLVLASAAVCAAGMCSASGLFAMDLVTKIPEQVSQNSFGPQSSPGTGQQSFVFGDWAGSRSWLSNRGMISVSAISAALMRTTTAPPRSRSRATSNPRRAGAGRPRHEIGSLSILLKAQQEILGTV